MVINKIVFTSPEAMVEFSGRKIKPRRSSKPFEHMQTYILLRATGKQNLRLPITQPRHAKNVK